MIRKTLYAIALCVASVSCPAQESGEAAAVRSWCDAWRAVDGISHALIREFEMKRGSSDHLTGTVTLTTTAPAWEVQCFIFRSASHGRSRSVVLSEPPSPGDGEALRRWASDEVTAFLASSKARPLDSAVSPTGAPVRVLPGNMLEHDSIPPEGPAGYRPNGRNAPNVHAKWLHDRWDSVRVKRHDANHIEVWVDDGPVYDFWQEAGTNEVWLRAFRAKSDAQNVWLLDAPETLAPGLTPVATTYTLVVRRQTDRLSLPFADGDASETIGTWRLHDFALWRTAPEALLTIDTGSMRELPKSRMVTENAKVVDRARPVSLITPTVPDTTPQELTKTPLRPRSTWSHWYTASIAIGVSLVVAIWLRLRR